MFNIAKLRLDTMNPNIFMVKVNSCEDYVTLTNGMKQDDPHYIFVNNNLCTLTASVDTESKGLIKLDLKLFMGDSPSRAIVTVYPQFRNGDEVVIFVHNQEILEEVNIVEILGEMNSYFTSLGDLATSAD